jgi:tRNA-dihydrouridine synthase
MAEISHRALRELIEGFGGEPIYYTEMISASAFLVQGPFEKYYADGAPCPERLVYQIESGEAGDLARAAAMLDALPCLGIDLNMGCAAPAIIRRGAGVNWMPHSDETEAADTKRALYMIRMVRGAVKKRLSVKLRLGWATRAEDAVQDYEAVFVRLVRFCQALEREGVEFITLHPRTAKMKFRREALWEYIPRLRAELRIPVAGNGDVTDPETMKKRLNCCDAIMIGRAAVKKPWIFRDAEHLCCQEEGITPDPADYLATGLQFLDLLARYQPPEFQLSRAKRFFGYFCDNLMWGNYVKNLLNKEESLAGIARAWESALREL